MKKAASLATVLALACLSTPAFADGQGHQGFVRAEFGKTDLDVSESGEPSVGDDDTAIGLGGGYWFNANFGIEGNYTNQYDKQIVRGIDLKVQSLGVGVVAKKNFGGDGNGFYLGGRAGAAQIDAELRGDGFSAEESKTGSYFGVNAGYDFSRNFGLGVNYTRYQVDLDGVDIDADVVSLSGEYRF